MAGVKIWAGNATVHNATTSTIFLSKVHNSSQTLTVYVCYTQFNNSTLTFILYEVQKGTITITY